LHAPSCINAFLYITAYQPRTSKFQISLHRNVFPFNDLQISAIPGPVETTQGQKLANINGKLANPLAGYSVSDLQNMGAAHAREKGIGELEGDFRKGACWPKLLWCLKRCPPLQRRIRVSSGEI
jgi:hypothetical protein